MNENNPTHPATAEQLEAMANALSACDQYQVLRRWQDFPTLQAAPEGAKLGLVVDTETTGKTATDRIIELGMVRFAFDAETGSVLGVLERFSALEDPGMPIPPEASAVNGITDEMVAGKRIDDAEVSRLAQDVSLVIAHNADFDRPKVEERFALFEALPWACSMSEVPWQEAGIETTKLKFIATELGHFYSAHRADADCEATLHALNTPLPKLGKTGLQFLLEAVTEIYSRLYASNSPFESKDTLKARGYRWSAGDQGAPKAWYTDLTGMDELEEEKAWLLKNVYKRSFSAQVQERDAYLRFSGRDAPFERIYSD